MSRQRCNFAVFIAVCASTFFLLMMRSTSEARRVDCRSNMNQGEANDGDTNEEPSWPAKKQWKGFPARLRIRNMAAPRDLSEQFEEQEARLYNNDGWPARRNYVFDME